MKALAIIFMILILFMMVGFAFFYILGFAMSFDAPGSDKDPAAWGMRIMMFMPGVILFIALVVAFISFNSGNYKRSMIVGAVPLGICAVFIVYMFVSSFTSLASYKVAEAKEAADAEKYPVQKFLRPVEGGADTVIVFPSRIVSYRLLNYNGYAYNGPLGALNDARTIFVYENSPDNKLPFSELDQFIDENGKRLSDLYQMHDEKAPKRVD